jgi:effector-binding domain-containing protein
MDYNVTLRVNEPKHTLIVRGRVPGAELPAFFGSAFGEVFGLAMQRSAPPDGPPFARFPGITPGVGPGAEVDVEAGVCVAREVEGSGRVVASVLPGGDAAVTDHIGPFDEMQPAYMALESWMREHDRVPAGGPWEIYYSDPAQEPDPQKWRTEIVWPLLPK